MSEIDTFDHEFIGFFGGIPIYHPLVHHRVEFSGEYVDFAPNQLIIGGGSGEHPAVILLKPEFAVASFLFDWLAHMEKYPDELEKLQINTDLWKKDFIEPAFYNSRNVFQFAGWSPDEYHSFIERCRSEKFNYPLIKTVSLTTWLAESLGEFIFRAMPELIPDLDKQLLGARKTVIGGKHMNVFVPPYGYEFPVHGRKVIDGKSQSGVRWKSSQA